MIDRVLEWVEVSGIIGAYLHSHLSCGKQRFDGLSSPDVLLLCPKAHLSAITNHLRTNWSSSSLHHYHLPLQYATGKHGDKAPDTLRQRSRLRIEVHTLDERMD